jgi:hypothetical protein
LQPKVNNNIAKPGSAGEELLSSISTSQQKQKATSDFKKMLVRKLGFSPETTILSHENHNVFLVYFRRISDRYNFCSFRRVLFPLFFISALIYVRYLLSFLASKKKPFDHDIYYDRSRSEPEALSSLRKSRLFVFGELTLQNVRSQWLHKPQPLQKTTSKLAFRPIFHT